jgi:NAD(P)H-flavin reductase
MATALADPLLTGPMVPRPHRVVRSVRETGDVRTLELEPVAGAPLGITPGQFTMLYAFGVGEVPISTSGGTPGGDGLVHTVRAVGAVTNAICAARPGAVLGVRGPYGNTWPLAEVTGADVLVVAGGLGLAPLRPAMYQLLANRPLYGNVALLYGGRSPEELLYRRELARWQAGDGSAVHVTVDSAGSGWRGHVGLVTTLIRRATFDPAATVALVCGPEIMMRFAALALVETGIAPDAIYVSLERTMRCGVGLCGHCQLGPTLVCRDGPVYRFDEIAPWLEVREL